MIFNPGSGGGSGIRVVGSGSWDRITFQSNSKEVQLDESASLLIVNTVYDEGNQNNQQASMVLLPGHLVLQSPSNKFVNVSLSADGRNITFTDNSAGAATTFYYQALAF